LEKWLVISKICKNSEFKGYFFWQWLSPSIYQRLQESTHWEHWRDRAKYIHRYWLQICAGNKCLQWVLRDFAPD